MPDGLNNKTAGGNILMLLNKQICRHSTNEISLQLLSRSVTMATPSSEKILDFQDKWATRLKTPVSSKLMIRYFS